MRCSTAASNKFSTGWVAALDGFILAGMEDGLAHWKKIFTRVGFSNYWY